MSLWIFLLYFCVIFYFPSNFCMFGFKKELCLPGRLNSYSQEELMKESKESKDHTYNSYEKEKKETSPRKRPYNENAKK